MELNEMEDEARQVMVDGFNWAQAVLAVGQKKMGMMEQGLLRGMAPMGGGIAYSGGACGALTGAIVLLGSLLGKDDPEKKDDPNLQKACSEFYKRFEDEVMAEWGSVNCRDITGIDWKDPVQVKAFRKEGGRLRCANFTGKAARILGEILEKYLEEKAF